MARIKSFSFNLPYFFIVPLREFICRTWWFHTETEKYTLLENHIDVDNSFFLELKLNYYIIKLDVGAFGIQHVNSSDRQIDKYVGNLNDKIWKVNPQKSYGILFTLGRKGEKIH